MDNKIDDVLISLGASRNVLLYGPPATGKTRLISELFQLLNNSLQSNRGIVLNPNEKVNPFTRPKTELAIPQPVKVIWTTFHQSYGYEDFVLGLRPEITSQGTRLEPWAGLFLDAAIELKDPKSKYKSIVIFIDEINRGNAARIFGEFMTFLDFDYREEGRTPLPIPLRQLKYKDGKSEKIRRQNGEEVELEENFIFPKHIYIVSTMNSVDRAAIPIDSALARRFDRIEMRPNLNVLAHRWNLEKDNISVPDEENWETLNPFVVAYLLLDKLNITIASDLGTEFELGHGLLAPITICEKESMEIQSEDEVWLKLAEIWDDVLFPQLEDRYSGRPEQLIELLSVDNAPFSGFYAWTLRKSIGKSVTARTLNPVRVSDFHVNEIKRSFRWLIR
ncbi:AAA family ATPase [Pantoea allii]|uniref:AAA family ATPase n=1 Tax=Pantoea allii TaxID=574096 RepID=UPI003D322B94